VRESLEKVEDFHRTFGLFLAERPTATVPPEVLATRLRLFVEELEEYREAAEAGDLTAIADALTDMLYVLFGTFVTHGLHHVAGDLFAEVHRSNMSKLDADGRPIMADGKVQKSELFSEPDLARILKTATSTPRARGTAPD
jgi:predicted HAD superfamily Cof-like phosphohydrolase